MRKNNYEVSCFTSCGKVRALNEDSYFIRQMCYGNDIVLLAVVADGMGGLKHGEQASQIVVQTLSDWWQQELPVLLEQNSSFSAIETSLEEIICCANQQIMNLDGKMGTTLSIVLLKDNQYLVKHAGDSRVYFGRTFGLEQVTRDQTWYEQELERGTLGKHLFSEHKMQSVLVNAIGVTPDYYLDTARGDLENIQTILLCTDGFYRYIHADTVWKILRKDRLSIQKKAKQLETILEHSEACDNYTAILIQKKRRGIQFAKFW